jgi:hypothetical protein
MLRYGSVGARLVESNPDDRFGVKGDITSVFFALQYLLA